MDQKLGAASDDVLDPPVSGGTFLTTEGRRDVDLSATIPGWGTDLDPARRPGVPRDKAPDIGGESLYPALPQQVPEVRIHKSTEHGRLTPVFGTSSPPRGLSGWIRDRAYHLSEGRLSRWVALMAADRIDVVEDVLKDLASLRVPNIPKEMGFKAELTHNRPAVVTRAAGLVILASALLMVRHGRRRR